MYLSCFKACNKCWNSNYRSSSCCCAVTFRVISRTNDKQPRFRAFYELTFLFTRGIFFAHRMCEIMKRACNLFLFTSRCEIDEIHSAFSPYINSLNLMRISFVNNHFLFTFFFSSILFLGLSIDLLWIDKQIKHLLFLAQAIK